MVHLAIQPKHGTTHGPCALCGQRTAPARGLQLLRADSHDAVCRDCGKKHAPSLVALLDLARAAERVGRIGRHTVSPPLSALLDLARAAEEYSYVTPQRHMQAV
jgi:hypothetical protein